jgi:hypothetical protein
MIPILTSDSYRGFSAFLTDGSGNANNNAQPVYVGRLVWPRNPDSEEAEEAEDALIKLYEADSCGTANEAIGYIANELRGIDQPKKGAILLLPPEALPPFNRNLEPYIDTESGMAVCWATTFQQDAKPFKFVRRIASFSEKQAHAFYQSRFCQALTGVDHVTGNNDRHEGNFLYLDDLKYLAIDQGNIGGGILWHKGFPDALARNELLALVQQNLNASQIAAWHSHAILEYHATEGIWARFVTEISKALTDLLTREQLDTIIDYMSSRLPSTKFAAQCGTLL